MQGEWIDYHRLTPGQAHTMRARGERRWQRPVRTAAAFTPVKPMIVRTTGSLIEALKSQPLALALVAINVMFLVGGGWFMHEVLDAARETRAALIMQAQCK